MDPRLPRASLVAVEAGRAVWVGSDDDLDRFKGTARPLDCEGKTVIPGFNDAHAHVLAYAARLLSVDCSPASVASIPDIQSTIRQYAANVPQGTWVKAAGYDEFHLRERRHPTRRDLDQAAPHHPVRLSHRSLHACVLNTAALALAGISIETPDPPGGLIDRVVGTGEPSGILFGMNSFINEKVVPPLSEREMKQGIGLANESYLSCGITSITDATVRNGPDQWQAFLGLRERGELAPRVSFMFGLDTITGLEERGLHPGYGDSGLRVGPLKIALDETSGRLNPTQEELNEGVLRAHRAGFQVAMHAVEEGTVEAVAEAVEHSVRQSPRADHRHRVEHCSVCPPPLLRRLKAVDAIVVTQPAFIYYSGDRYLDQVSGTQLPWLYRTRSFLENGLRPAAGSDCPVAPCSPLAGLYAAVTRRARSGQVLSPEEAVSPLDALGMYTLAGAYACFEDREKGSIETGKLADIVVLSADPTALAPDELLDIRVEKTIIGGEVVWEL
jgi:predicted amidohydrolase YtcJ